MTKTLLPLCAALLLFPATGFAAPASGSGQLNDEGATVTQTGETREVIFGEDETIEGEILSPDGAPVGGMRHKKLESMISIRTHFLAQLIALSSDI